MHPFVKDFSLRLVRFICKQLKGPSTLSSYTQIKHLGNLQAFDLLRQDFKENPL
jgi:hypothetical protein